MRLRVTIRLLPLLPVLLVCAGCPEQITGVCPEAAINAGQFLVNLKLRETEADNCRVAPADGGAPDASLGIKEVNDSATLCAEKVPDGGVVVYYAPARGPRRQSPLVDGGFKFESGPFTFSGTGCSCPIAESETIEGVLQLEGDAGFAFDGDGGVSRITGLTGRVEDRVTAVAGGGRCLCALPCAIRYDLTGTRP